MKNVILTSASVLALSAMIMSCGGSNAVKAGDEQAAAQSTALSKNYTVDVAGSQLGWLGEKVTGKHNGTIGIQSGSIAVENDAIKAGEFVIDMKTIVNQDITDAKSNGDLVGHLSSPDFFDVAKFPTSKFVITQTEKLAQPDSAGNNFKINGNLTIKDVTKNIPILAKVTMDSTKFEATSKFTIDRTEWNVQYGSGKFFKGLGDKMIKDEIQFDLMLKANAQ